MKLSIQYIYLEDSTENFYILINFPKGSFVYPSGVPVKDISTGSSKIYNKWFNLIAG